MKVIKNAGDDVSIPYRYALNPTATSIAKAQSEVSIPYRYALNIDVLTSAEYGNLGFNSL